MWSGGVVGLKSILGSRSRVKSLEALSKLSELGYISYSLNAKTKKLTYQITDWVIKCSGEECMDGTVYATEGYGFLCLYVTSGIFHGCLKSNGTGFQKLVPHGWIPAIIARFECVVPERI